MDKATFISYCWCVLGIVISVVLPVLWNTVNYYFPTKSAAATRTLSFQIPEQVKSLWHAIKPYIVLGLASALTAFLIVAVVGKDLADYRAAILAGYAWDSTLQKFRSAKA